MANILFGVGILAGLLFLVWVVWAYHRYGKLKNISGVVTLAAIIAALPLGIQMAMERTRVVSQASEQVLVNSVQVETLNKDKVVVYVTLSDAGFSYLEFGDANNKQTVLSQGKIEPRIGHAFILENVSKMSSKNGKIFVNGKIDPKPVAIP